MSIVGASDGGASDRVVDSHVRNLRAKIEIDPKQPRLILTVVGFGYKTPTRDILASGRT